jgi:hypothetical protein
LGQVPAEVVAHEVGVLGDVDGLEGEEAETLPPVDGLILGGGGAAAAGLGAPLTIHGVGEIWLADPRPALLCSILLCGSGRLIFLQRSPRPTASVP